MNEESNKLVLMKKFRDQLVTFLDEIIEQFPTESDFVLIRMFIKDQIPVHDILGRFIRDILPLKECVEKRDETFFLNNTLLYTGGNISSDKINHFQKLWKSDKLDVEDRETIWNWMECFIKISDCYFQKYGYINGWEKIE
jgi:hypothetical protein